MSTLHPLRMASFALLAPSVLLTLAFFGGGLVVMLVFSLYGFTGGLMERTVTGQAWAEMATDGFYWEVIGRSARIAAIVSVIALLIGYPAALALNSLRSPGWIAFAYFVIFAPLLVAVVVRAYGWILLLAEAGFVRWAMDLVGLPPTRLLYDEPAVIIALVHVMLPYMIFPIASVLRQIDPALNEAARDLGAGRLRCFLYVTLPLSLGGVVAGLQIVFTLAMSAFTVPVLLGGGRVLVFSKLIFDNVSSLNWPMGAVQSLVLIGATLFVVMAFELLNRRLATTGR